MPDTLPGQEKKSPSKKESYDEVVTVRHWTGKIFLNPVENVLMFRGEIDKKTVFYTMPKGGNDKSPKGSEITDKDGEVWIVDKVTADRLYHINYVTKKPVEKKPQ